MTKTGRVGGSVFRIRYGETIESQYQPVVRNPNTAKQVETRAKLKLGSQLAAVMAPVVAMTRVGAVSSRNLFIKANYGALNYVDGTADIELAKVKLTKSVVGVPELRATRQGTTVTISFTQSVAVSRVVYAVFLKQADNTLRFYGSRVVTEPGTDGYFPAEIAVSAVPAVVYAYGIRDNNDAAKTVFGDMQVLSAETVAKLIVSRTLTESDITLTETAYTAVPGSTMLSNETTNKTVGKMTK